MLKVDGFLKVMEKIKGKFSPAAATGYSVSGVVIGTGRGVTKFKIGQPVAAAGAGRANHAEFVDVPENLVVKIPDGLDFKEASSVALGSIALHGVRRANLKMGEFGVVFGSGVIGLIAVQLLKLSGVRVIAVDLDDRRLKIAQQLGAEIVINPQNEDPVKVVENFSGGVGVDVVLFTAATDSSEPISRAFQMCRKKGRVVLVGVAGMNLKREDLYAKEIDLIMATSYGPGRYDNDYEQKGQDYPYAYVRWTENRNMAEYLRLLATGQIKLEKLINGVFPVERAEEAFGALQNEKVKPLMVLLDYGPIDSTRFNNYSQQARKIFIQSKSINRNLINVALIGAGNFATAVHLPNIQNKLSSKYNLYSVIDKEGQRARAVAQKYGAAYASTNFEDVLNDENVDLILICTRHDSHGDLVMKALKAGKNVFVEKPLATNLQELEEIEKFYSEESLENKPLLMVGFNRRFSKYAQEIKKHTNQRINPLFILYRMNAGYAPADDWTQLNGGRIIGEACHQIDLVSFFTGAKIQSVSFESLTPKTEKFSESDNKSIILKYKDGSLATVEYLSCGHEKLPKEYLEIHFDGKTIVLKDFKSLSGYGLNIARLTTAQSEKGHLEELERLFKTLKGIEAEWPITLEEMLEVTAVTIQIVDQAGEFSRTKSKC
jgi:predicted dehydrogenase/threonine dehydrogenase-like Zn-dependent dehydrogenase